MKSIASGLGICLLFATLASAQDTTSNKGNKNGQGQTITAPAKGTINLNDTLGTRNMNDRMNSNQNIRFDSTGTAPRR